MAGDSIHEANAAFRQRFSDLRAVLGADLLSALAENCDSTAVDRREALSWLAGLTCFMDGSVRDWQRHTSQVTAGKNFARSGAMGPCLVTPDEVPPLEDLRLETRINGPAMQAARVSDLIFDAPALIEYSSTFMELLPGDVIVTGTPRGVGVARRPPVWLEPGDRVEVDIGGVGCLRVTVCAD